MFRVTNRDFRRVILWLSGLTPNPKGHPLADKPVYSYQQQIYRTIYKLGFVQIDPVSAVERAHHHILFTRNRFYRKNYLKQLLEKDHTIFENWTHDAALLPTVHYPYWKHYFARAQTFEAHPGYRRYFAPVTKDLIKDVMTRIENEGPLRSRDFKSDKVARRDPYFAQPTHAKLAMEFLWRTGKLAVSHRRGQEKVYDLARRVIPSCHFEAEVSREKFIDWACLSALKRLGFARPTQIAHFYDAVSTADVVRWCGSHMNKRITKVEVVLADGSIAGPVYTLISLLDLLAQVPLSSRKLRLINPFDPLIHDRRRTKEVFGFEYALEMWFPATKRQYGYYVLPILEGQRFTGRIDLRADRDRGKLKILGLWWEPQTTPTSSRRAELEGALSQLARFSVSK